MQVETCTGFHPDHHQWVHGQEFGVAFGRQKSLFAPLVGCELELPELSFLQDSLSLHSQTESKPCGCRQCPERGSEWEPVVPAVPSPVPRAVGVSQTEPVPRQPLGPSAGREPWLSTGQSSGGSAPAVLSAQTRVTA